MTVAKEESTVPATYTTGVFPVAQLPAAQIVLVRVFLTNLENDPHRGTIEVSRLVDGGKERLRLQQVVVPPDERVWIELSSAEVEGENIEVTVTLPEDGFDVGATPLVPGVAVLSRFVGDDTTTLLQWISADGFVPVPREEPRPPFSMSGVSYT